jgi:hypothetical protein
MANKNRKRLSNNAKLNIGRGVEKYWKTDGRSRRAKKKKKSNVKGRLAKAAALTGVGAASLYGAKKAGLDKKVGEHFKNAVEKTQNEAGQKIEDVSRESGRRAAKGATEGAVQGVKDAVVGGAKSTVRGVSEAGAKGVEATRDTVTNLEATLTNQEPPKETGKTAAIVIAKAPGAKQTFGLGRKTRERFESQAAMAGAQTTDNLFVKSRKKASKDIKTTKVFGKDLFNKAKNRAKKDIARRKKRVGFSSARNEFWLEFDNRKSEALEFAAKKGKPLSAAHKRKISRSLKERNRGGQPRESVISKANKAVNVASKLSLIGERSARIARNINRLRPKPRDPFATYDAVASRATKLGRIGLDTSQESRRWAKYAGVDLKELIANLGKKKKAAETASSISGGLVSNRSARRGAKKAARAFYNATRL